MNTMRALITGVLALGACDLFEDSELEIRAGSGETPVYTTEWPPGSGEQITVNNSLTDSAGLAGLEVDVFAPGGPDIMLTAEDFDRHYHTYGPIAIERDVEARVFARLRQHGTHVAEGSIAWTLGDRTRWEVMIVRHTHPGFANENLNCGVLCEKAARFPISEDSRNYPTEHLWLTLRHRDGWEG